MRNEICKIISKQTHILPPFVFFNLFFLRSFASVFQISCKLFTFIFRPVLVKRWRVVLVWKHSFWDVCFWKTKNEPQIKRIHIFSLHAVEFGGQRIVKLFPEVHARRLEKLNVADKVGDGGGGNLFRQLVCEQRIKTKSKTMSSLPFGWNAINRFEWREQDEREGKKDCL